MSFSQRELERLGHELCADPGADRQAERWAFKQESACGARSNDRYPTSRPPQWHQCKADSFRLPSERGDDVTGERNEPSEPRDKDAALSLRQVFERAWPLDRKPVFGALVQAIDNFDREQRRRRKERDAADRLG